MKEYVKPVVLANEDLAEGVYAASGDCWSVNARSVQDWNGSENVFEVRMTHSSDLQHISGECRIRLEFSQTLTGASAEADSCTWSGKTVEITRLSHGNAYVSGDTTTFKVWIKCADEATTKAVTCLNAFATYCDRQTNVQGGND